ncbi:hypothetical protein P4V63_01890, partial [Bacillus toyonensis]|nr:hypothetical protein [Bacillus toyonensis]
DSNGFKLSIESLTKKDTDISNKLNTVEQTVEGTKKTISDVQQTANDLKKTTTEIKEQAGKISEKLTSVEKQANTLTNKTTEIEKSMDGIKETVTKVENNQNGFDKRVTAVEKTAEGISQNVTKIQETQTVQGKQITEAQSTIKQHSDALDLTVKMKDVENYVGGIGSINEIRNAGLELGNKYWSINQGTAVQPSSKYKGYATFWSDYSGKTSDHWSGTASEFIAVTAGEDLISTGWFATDNIASLDQKAWMEIEFWNATKGTRMRTQRVEIQWAKQGDWARMMMVSKVAANEEWVRWRYYVQRNGRIRAALPMLQRGKVATEFWLHPKDQTDADKMIEDIANRVATKDYDKKVTELE